MYSIVGYVVEGDCGSFFLKLVPNCKSEVLAKLYKKHMHPGSIIVTDGYPSYSNAVREFGSTHEMVNHSLGFVTTSGVSTNQTENLWLHLRQEMVLITKDTLIYKRVFLEEKKVCTQS